MHDNALKEESVLRDPAGLLQNTVLFRPLAKKKRKSRKKKKVDRKAKTESSKGRKQNVENDGK